METIQEKDLSFDSSISDRNECEIPYETKGNICNTVCKIGKFVGSIACKECRFNIQVSHTSRTVICLLANNH